MYFNTGAARTSALPVVAFKESGSSSSSTSSKNKSQGGLRALKNIEIPKVDLSKIEIDLPEVDVSAVASGAAAEVASFWEKSEEKPAVVALAVSSFVALIALSAVANAVDSVPLVSNFLEFVGLGASGWFAYRNLAFGPDREALKKKIEAYWSKIFS